MDLLRMNLKITFTLYFDHKKQWLVFSGTLTTAHEAFWVVIFMQAKSKTCNFLECLKLLDIRMTSFVSFVFFCWRTSAADSLIPIMVTVREQGWASQGEELRPGLVHHELRESASPPLHNHIPSVHLPLPPVISHTVTVVLLLQMWTNAWPTPTVVDPASAVWTQWVHLYASCRSLVLQATSWGTVFVRVSSLLLMYFIKPIYLTVMQSHYSSQWKFWWCFL